MKYIYLDYKSNEFVVDDESYETIMALVQAGKLCTHSYHDKHPYSLDNPCVAKGICLQHLLEKQSNLMVLDSLGTDADGRHRYRFVNMKGFVYTSTEDYSEEATLDMKATLAYYGFTPPEQVVSRGKSVTFYIHYGTFYGDLRTASAIVLDYHHHAEKVKGLFLLYKNGPCEELSRKSDVYHRADALVEASRNTQGEYVINGHAHPNKFEADVFEVISQLESAVYDVTRKLQNGGASGGL